jgi:hypothetical protein
MITTVECRDLAVPTKNSLSNLKVALPPVSEVCWFLLSLLLFMILGPFAAPIAVFSIFSLKGDERGKMEPEPAD